MGIIRILLALAVVLDHVGPVFGVKYIDGTMAVQSFFIISGFYIGLIINEKYNFKNAYKLFISNRVLRLFPTYFFIIVLTLISVFICANLGVKDEMVDNISKPDVTSKIYLAFLNLSIIGQETALYLGFDARGALHYVSDFQNSTPPVYIFLLCRPAWSLSLELMFYLIAPFLVKRKTATILLIMAGSLILRIFLYKQGLNYDPWTYRFFPTELFFFLAGAASYKMYNHLKQSSFIQKQRWYMLLVIPVLLFVFNYVPVDYWLKQYIFYTILIFAIPVLFAYTKNSSVDRSIGELSYPIYLSHSFIIMYCMPLFRYLFHFSRFTSFFTIVFTIGFSIALVLYLIKPIEKYRAKRVKLFKGT